MKRSVKLVRILSSISLLINVGLFYSVCELNHKVIRQEFTIKYQKKVISDKEKDIQKFRTELKDAR